MYGIAPPTRCLNGEIQSLSNVAFALSSAFSKVASNFASVKAILSVVTRLSYLVNTTMMGTRDNNFKWSEE